MRLVVALYAILAVALISTGHRSPLHAQTAPTTIAGFTDTVVLRGFSRPTVVAFASDGRVFVGEKAGIIKVFDSVGDQTATVFADLRVRVHNWGDRGLLGMALDPEFPEKPYIYMLYTHDAPIGSQAPTWDVPGDPCQDRQAKGCVASGRLSRLPVSASGTWTGTEQVLIEDWFQQFS